MIPYLDLTLKFPKPGPRRRVLLRAMAIAALVVLAAFLCQWESVAVLKVRNGSVFFSDYPVQEEDWDHPRLKLLREREQLDRVVFPGRREFDKIVLLRKWAHSQWSGGDNRFYYPPWDAVEILDLARKRGNKAFCAQYAIVFLQACLSMGLPARYVDLPGHFVAEVWSDDYDRWVVMDPTSDRHFEKDGVPLNGRRLCAAYWKGKWGDIEVVGSDGKRRPATKDDLAPYRGFSIVRRTNHLSLPEEVSVNGQPLRRLTLEKDFRKYPFVGRDSVSFGADFVAWDQRGMTERDAAKKYSRDPDDFRDKVNQTVVVVAGRDAGEGTIKLALRAENASTFGGFLVSGEPGDWRPAGPRVVWRLSPGINRIEARIRTRFGWLGPPSSIEVFYKPRVLRRLAGIRFS